MDQYDRAVAILTADPGLIPLAYSGAAGDDLYCLFTHVSPTGGIEWLPSGEQAADVARIRAAAVEGGHIVHGWTWELTRAIRGDRHLPDDAGKITVGHLPRFAMWQRRIDKALGRVPPPGRGG